MAQHVRELFIHGYKGIHELKLEQLNSINILTGDNNSGKTSILELLRSNPCSGKSRIGVTITA